MNQFDPRQCYDNLPIGTVLQSPLNLECITNGKFVAMDGRDCLRGDYPDISEYFPGGVFTGTSRTLNATPVSPTLVSDGTNWLCPGAAGTSPLQASADTASWSTSATWGASTSPACIIVAGSRYIMAGSGGDLTVPYVSATGQTAANQVAKSNWTATTVAGTSTLAQSMAYSPQLGRTVLIPDAAGTTIYTLDDGATAWVSRSHTTSRTKKAVVWTGQKFIVFTSDNYNILLTSTDGITWVEQVVPHACTWNAGAPNAVASNGNGIVVAAPRADIGNNLIVTTDHGMTWRRVLQPQTMRVQKFDDSGYYPNLNVFCLNNKFIAQPQGWQLAMISNDARGWQEESLFLNRGGSMAYPPKALAYKSGIYLGIQGTSSSACSWIEDMSRFRMFDTAIPLGGNSGNFSSMCALHMEYMKVRM